MNRRGEEREALLPYYPISISISISSLRVSNQDSG
jgi:hypothetical protein